MYLRPTHPCSLLTLVVVLALFFGLFFGLNYPEIVRHGWPLAQCTVLDAKVATRYCCETSCETSSCKDAPSGSPVCSSIISQIDSGYSPSTCAANSSTCPVGVGGFCDGGYYCCNTCCSTCTSCSTSCTGNSCSQQCTTYSCNCSCCSSSAHLRCTLSCPICFDVDLTLSYRTRAGVLVNNVTYVQDFKKNNNSAVAFFRQHLVNSTSYCHYDPRNLSQVLYNVHFTAWKWAITALFGMFPLAVFLGFYSVVGLIIPAWYIVKSWAASAYQEARQAGSDRYRSLAIQRKRDAILRKRDAILRMRDKMFFSPTTPTPPYKEDEDNLPPPAYTPDDIPYDL